MKFPNWPDIFAISVVFIVPVVLVYLVVYFPRLFALGSKYRNKFRSYLSMCFLFFFGVSGCYATIIYYELRKIGESPSYELIYTTLDYSLGVFFVVFLTTIPAIYVGHKAIVDFEAEFENLFSNSEPESKLVSALFLLVLIGPGILISRLLIKKSWLTNVITGSPIAISELDAMDKSNILTEDLPYLLSSIMERFYSSLGITNTSLYTLIGLIAVVLAIAADSLTILSHYRELKEEADLEDDDLIPEVIMNNDINIAHIPFYDETEETEFMEVPKTMTDDADR